MNNECKSCGVDRHKDCSCPLWEHSTRKVIDTVPLEPSEYISKTNQDGDSIRQDNEQAISKDIDVGSKEPESISVQSISNNIDTLLRALKPRVIYYQNGECQRTLI